jgi:hypothetical protein
VEKTGKRRKIHNFPTAEPAEIANPSTANSQSENWRRRLAALVAATGRTETDLLEESIQLLAMKVLRLDNGGAGPSHQA